jgi:hypothetical protein
MSWVERDISWHRTDVAYCEVTGQLLPPRYWRFEDDGRVIRARDPHCEELYRRYLRPGKRAGEAESGQRSTAKE